MTKTSGLTITELLVVLVIISIVLAIAIPALQRTRDAARETVCKNNVRQLNMALSQLGETEGIPNFNSDMLIAGWSIAVLPYIDQSNLKDALPVGGTLDQLPESRYRPPSILRCPAQSSQRSQPIAEIPHAHYVMIARREEKRSTFSIAEAPESFKEPWITSPELESFDKVDSGPHHGGYFYAYGFQQAVRFRKLD